MTRKPTSSKPREVVTLDDLSPRRRVTGGNARRVFGADAPDRPAQKDLPPGKDVRGGRIVRNDNLTLVRAKAAARSRQH